MAKGPSAMKLVQVKAIAGTPSSRAEQKGPSAEKLAEVRANAASGAASRVKTGQDYIIEALQGYGKTPTRYDTQYDPVTGFELATPGAAVKDAAAPAQKQSAQTKKSAFVPTEPKIDPNESAVEKLGRWMSGASSDTTTPVTPANDSTDYAMRRAMGGAVSSAAGFANAVGYYGQGALRGQLAQQEAQQKADYAVTGDAGSKALAEQKASQLKESEDKGLQTTVTWGDSFNRETAQDYDPDKTLKVVGDVTEGVGGMVPSILSNYFVPGSSLFVMAAGAAGNAVREAKQNGASDTAALTYGTAVGVVEAATEKMFDGVSGVFGKGLADDAIDALVQKYIGNEAAQKAVTVLVNTLGEGAEEFVAEVVENWINRVTANTDARRGKKLLGDAWYSFAVGGLVSAVMQAANAGNFDAKQVAQNAVDAMDSGVSDAGETQAKAEQTAQEKPAAKTGADYILEAEKAANGTPSAEAPTAAQEAPQAAVQTDTESAVPPVLNSFKTPPDAAERGANKAGSPAEILSSANGTVNAEDSTGAAPGGFTGDRAALDEKYMDAADKNGAMPERGNLSRQVPVPKSMDGETVIPQTVQTAMGSEVTPASQVGQTTQDVALGRFNYDSITDKSSVSRAEQTIRDKGFQQALTDWTADVRSGKVGKDLTTLGITLYNNAANSGDGKTAAVILADMVSSVRSGAQSTQAVNLFNKMDPQYQLYTIERSVQNMQDELTGKYRDKAPDLQIDPELVQTFLDADTDKARQDAMDSIYQNIADQMPSSWKDRFNAWRYLSMLGNPRTHIRNIIGNAGFAPVRVVKNLIASGIEAVSIGKNAGRTKSILMPTAEDYARVRAGWSDYDGVVDQIQSGGKFKSDYNEIRDRQTIFGFKPLEWVRRANNTALDAEDTWFSRPAYAESLASYLKANGVTAAEYLAEDYDRSAAQAYAIREAQKATYRDYNSFSDAISRIGFKNPKNAVEKGINTLVEGILPFKRTPANILARAVEYSPAGLVKGLYDAAVNVRNGNVTAAEAIDEVSSGLTGTGLLTLGFFLAKMGLVNGGGSGDDKQDEFTKTKGIQNYSVNIGYKTYTLDWLAPEALPFFVGVEAFNRMSDGNMTGDDMWDSLKQITDPLVEMSMLQGVNDAIDSINYAVQGGSTGITAAITSPIVSYLSQFIPTLGGQIERTAEDETRQTTYVDRESIIPTDIQYAIAKAANKIPGVDYEQMDYIDAWGRTQSSGGAAQRAIGNFLSPGYISEKTGTPADSELERLYKAGYTGVYPSRVQASVRINDAYLTKDQYQTYAKEKGKTSLNLVTELVQSDYYSKLTDAQKAKAVSGMYDYAADLAAYKAVGDDWDSAWHKDASSQSTSDTADLIAYKAILAESSSADEAEQKALEIGISQKAVLSTLSDSAKSDYEKYIKDTDVDLKDYLSAYNFSNDAKREGTDENGAAPKERTIGYIDGMFSGDEYDDEKDAIYRALGFSESGLSKTPWHN